MELSRRQCLLLIVFLISLIIFLYFFHYFPDEISFYNNEFITSQYLNSVDVFISNDLSSIGMNAYLDGNVNSEVRPYSNFPIFHIYFGALLVDAGILTNEFSSFQFITISISFFTLLFISLFLFEVTKSRVSILVICLLILSNKFLLNTYTDLWWGPYFLFFVSSQLFFFIKKKFIFLYCLGFFQFWFNYDSSVYVFSFMLGYLFLQTYNCEKSFSRTIKRLDLYAQDFVLIKYFFFCVASFVISSVIRLYLSSDIPDGETISSNFFDIDRNDLFRFIYYFVLSPLVLPCLIFLFITTRKFDRTLTLLLCIWSCSWIIIFPAHGLHHAYHYSKIFIIVLYCVMTVKILSNREHFILLPIILLLNLIAGYYFLKSPNIDYSEYKIANSYTSGSSQIATNYFSYPLSYFVHNNISVETGESLINSCSYQTAIVIEGFSQTQVGLSQINSLYRKVIKLITTDINDIPTYAKLRDVFEKDKNQFKQSLVACGLNLKLYNTSLPFSIYAKDI